MEEFLLVFLFKVENFPKETHTNPFFPSKSLWVVLERCWDHWFSFSLKILKLKPKEKIYLLR